MVETTNDILQALSQLVHDDPALQRQLFAVSDPADFIAEISQLARLSGHALADDEVLQAMRLGRKSWSDRKLP